MIVVSDTITLTAITINDQEKLFELMSRIYLPDTAIFGLMTEAGIWKYIPTPIWNEIYSQLILLFCSVSIANNWDFKIDRKYSFG
jgi:hypothetical protein